MNLTVSRTGFVLVSIPLIFQLVFVVLVLWFDSEQVGAEKLAIHSKEVISQTHLLGTALSDAQAGVLSYVLAAPGKRPDPLVLSRTSVPEAIGALEDLVEDNPAQVGKVKRIRKAAISLLEWYEGVEQLVRERKNDAATERIRSGVGENRMKDFRSEIGSFLTEERRLDERREADLDRSRERMNGTIAVGSVAAIASALALAFAFRKRVGRRFAALENNARHLALGKELPPPLEGGDEIAGLDRAFRDMAEKLGRTVEDLRTNEERLRLFIDSVPDSFLMLDASGCVASWNAGAERMMGYRAEQILGAPVERFYPPEAIAQHRPEQELREAESVGRFQDEGWRIRKDGSRFWAGVVVGAMRGADGKLLGFSKVTRDLTDRKRAEDEIRGLNEDLERRVRDRTADLAETNRDLGRRNEENEMFVYSVSHDLRSPLVNLQGFSKELERAGHALAAILSDESVPATLRSQGHELLDGKMAKSIRFIQAAVVRLSTIIDALLRLSRAGRVEYRWETVDVSEIVGRVIAAAQATIEERGATVTVGDLPPARGDRTAIEQVFGNLIGNALTYLDPSRPGLIEVGSVAPERKQCPAGFWAYYVRDNGLGIAEAHQRKIFNAFQRAHPGIGSGEGLGLAIVNCAAGRHGGRVWVESQSGQGSAFFVCLPAAPARVREASQN